LIPFYIALSEVGVLAIYGERFYPPVV